MRSASRLPLFALGLLALTATAAQAQPAPNVTSRPTFSPYLNLINRGNSPALNYLGIVRPQQQMAQQFNQLSQQYQQTTNGLQNSIDGLAQGNDPTLRTTGYVATFGNTGGYFNRNPISGGGGGMSGGSRVYSGGQNRGASSLGNNTQIGSFNRVNLGAPGAGRR